MNRRHQQRGFSLLEILLIIGILGIVVYIAGRLFVNASALKGCPELEKEARDLIDRCKKLLEGTPSSDEVSKAMEDANKATAKASKCIVADTTTLLDVSAAIDSVNSLYEAYVAKQKPEDQARLGKIKLEKPRG